MSNAVSDPRAVWTRLASFYDSAVAEGNDFQTTLVFPPTLRLLSPAPSARQKILDIACGNGNFSRLLARSHAARVLGFDLSPGLVAAAHRRTSEQDWTDLTAPRFLEGDATDPAFLSSLASDPLAPFDAAVSNMALMDLPTLEPLLTSLHRLLAPSARFVFSIPHPCFNSPDTRMTADLANTPAGPRQTFSISLSSYLTPRTVSSPGLLHQPEPNPFFHRPLSLLFKLFADTAWRVESLEEPAFPPTTPSRHPFTWKSRPDLPPVLLLSLVPTRT